MNLKDSEEKQKRSRRASKKDEDGKNAHLPVPNNVGKRITERRPSGSNDHRPAHRLGSKSGTNGLA
jgi:hypothetical protein